MVTALCAAGAVLAAALADAATPAGFEKGPLYGGGRLGGGELDQLLTIRVSKDRKQLNLFPTVAATCGNGRVVTRKPQALGVAVKSDGSFGGSSTYTATGESGTLSYEGKFDGADPVTGTMRLEFTAGKLHCDTDRVAWRARAPSNEPGSGSAKKGASYFGTRRDGGAVEFRVGSGGRTVTHVFFEVRFTSAQCNGAAPPPAQGIGTTSPIRIKDDEFRHAEGFYVWSGGAPDAEPPMPSPANRASIRWKIEAKFGKHRVEGVLGFTADLHDAQGRVMAHCDSPKAPIRLERG